MKKRMESFIHFVYTYGMKKRKKIFIIVLAAVIGLPLLTVGGYVLYVVCSYHRIGNKSLDVSKGTNAKEKINSNEEISITSFNIGFGAYSPDYTFFLDEGINEDGTKTIGKYGKGISKDDVQKNVDGIKETIQSLNSDIFLLQEVDIDSDRAYHINQKETLDACYPIYDKTFAINFDSAYLFYPLNDPHGKSKAGLSTMSSFSITSSERKEYTIANSFSKFFDLDRCFSVNRIQTDNDKELVLINSHMSAYDEGGLIRNKQIKELYSFMKEESDKGNFVIAGGDFNHDLLTSNPMYSYTRENFAFKDMIKQQMPTWLNFMFEEDSTSPFDEGFKIYADNSEPSCRDCDVVWDRGSTYVSTVDGFIVSDNVKVNSIKTTKVGENGFAYSDHQPTTLKFELK